MEETKRKKEYIKKVKNKKLNKFSEIKILNFAMGSSFLMALIFLFNSYDFILKKANYVMLYISFVYFLEILITYLYRNIIKKQILSNGAISRSLRKSSILLIGFVLSGNIFSAIAGFTIIKEERTIEYNLSIYSIINSLAIIMVTSLNLFKTYVSNTFVFGMSLLIIFTLIYIVSIFMISIYIKGKHVDKKMIPVAVILIISSLIGNIFALLTGIIIITKYRHKDQDRSIGWIDIIERLFRNNMAIIGLLVVVFMLSLSITSVLTFDYSIAIDNNYSEILKPISLMFPFGTDNYGRCAFTRIVFGARISLIIGICVTLLPIIIGGTLGAVAGYYSGKVDNIIMRFLDIQYAVPGILLAIAIVSAFGASTLNLVIALSIGSIPSYARTVRATVLGLSNAEFVEAARACGAKDNIIIFKHIIPNSLAPIIVRATIGVGSAVLSTSSLSYLGLGVEPYVPEWGNILKTGSKYLESNPHLAIFPGIAIIILVLSFNFFGDGLRDALDPKLK